MRFRIIETGGRTIKSMVQKSNPTATTGCEELGCLPCKTGKGEGGDCRRCGVNYSIECQLCPDGQKCLYHGETARNLFTRIMKRVMKEIYKNPSCSNIRGRITITDLAVILPR